MKLALTLMLIGGFGLGAGLVLGQERYPRPAPTLIPFGLFELNEQQRQGIRQAQRDFHARYCDVTGRMLDAQYEIRDLYARTQRDPKQIGQAFRNLAVLQQQLIEARITAENRAEAVLTNEQRQKLHARRKGRLPGAYSGDLPYMMHPGIQDDTFAPYDREEREQYPVPPQYETERP